MNTACPNCEVASGYDGKQCRKCGYSMPGSVVIVTEMIRFLCPGCGKRMKAPTEAAGRTATCRACSTRLIVPCSLPIQPRSVASSPEPTNQPPTATVPMKVSLPNVGVVVEAQVSQPAADQIASNVATGVLVGAAILGTVALAITAVVACPPLAGALAAGAAALASSKKA